MTVSASYPRGGSRCFYDTNVVAAYILGEEERVEIAERVLRGCTARGISVITLHELAHIALKRGLEARLGEAITLLERAFKIHELTRDASLKAARIRLEYGIPEVDSLILATAVEAEYNTFYTFDADFSRLHGEVIGQTRVVYLEQHT